MKSGRRLGSVQKKWILHIKMFNYRPPKNLGKVMFSVMSVILITRRGSCTGSWPCPLLYRAPALTPSICTGPRSPVDMFKRVQLGPRPPMLKIYSLWSADCQQVAVGIRLKCLLVNRYFRIRFDLRPCCRQKVIPEHFQHAISVFMQLMLGTGIVETTVALTI